MMKKALQGSLAAAAGIALGLGASGVALAQDGQEPPVASGDVVTAPGVRLHGSVEGVEKNVQASMIGLQLGESDTRVVYCIQIHVDLIDGNTHEERAWDDVPVESLPLVLGVLLNGYNGGNADELIEEAGVADQDFESFSSEQIAYAGTQAAVWSLTDNWLIDSDDPTAAGDGVDTAVSTIQSYLIENSEPVEEPDMEPYFETDDSAASVEGSVYGPFTVSTNLGSVNFQQPEGATIVDENGDAITQFTDGQTFYVDFGEEQSASVSFVTDSVTWVTPVGRAFVPVDGDSNTLEGQNLILGESHEEEITAELQFDIVIEEVPEETSPAAQPQLPQTGTNLTMVAGIGGAVLAAGVVALVLMRRRAATAGGDWGGDGDEK